MPLSEPKSIPTETFLALRTPPATTPRLDVTVESMGGRLCELVSQTSETKAMAISLLKHINGDPLITNTTLVDL